MASEYYLDITTKKGGKVKGESDSNLCPEQIDINKFTIGLTSPGGVDESGEAVTSGRIHLDEAEFELDTDCSCVALFSTICTNDPIKTCILSCCKAGNNGKTGIYLQWKFNDARLVSYKMSGGEDGMPEDTIRIAYSGIEIMYKKQKPDGSLPANGNTAAYGSNENQMVTATLK
jgi:type VI secretion system secreted protein Hcp